MSSIISGVTIIDGIAENPIRGQSIWIEGGRVKAIGRREDFGAASGIRIIDGHNRYVIPGLMNANVHLLMDIRLESLARHWGHYEDVIAEAAQVALKNGLTTVFDTWGPRRFLMAVRDRINAGEVPGSRIFCAGNILGFDGPFSADYDFFGKGADVVSAALARRINAIWVENVGRHLMWLMPEQVALEVRTYIGKGIDFVKYASNDHFPGAFLAFSPQVQAAIVEEAHRAGTTAQAHTMSVEGLRVAVEAGCDLIQHANITGPVPIPERTLELTANRKTGTVVFPWTRRGFDWIMEHVTDPAERTMWISSDTNTRNLIRSGARLLMGNDGSILPPEMAAELCRRGSWAGAPQNDALAPLGSGHFTWLKAMEEKGCPPMEILKAATINIASAYGKDKHLGTLEPGKIADMVVLDKNPLDAAENYRSIHMIIKDGIIVDRESLPLNPILTKPMEPPAEEEECYVPFLEDRKATFPISPCACTVHRISWRR